MLNQDNVTSIETANHLLSKALEELKENQSLLSEEGLMRIAAAKSEVSLAHEKLMDDSSWGSVAEDPHLFWGVLQKVIFDTSLSLSAQKILKDTISKQNLADIDFQVCIKELVKNNCQQEAKLIHNLRHFGYLVAQNSEKNRMTPCNVDSILFAMISRWVQDDSPDFLLGNAMLNRKIQEAAAANTDSDPLNLNVIDKDNHKVFFGESFEQRFPEEEKKIKKAKRTAINLDVPLRGPSSNMAEETLVTPKSNWGRLINWISQRPTAIKQFFKNIKLPKIGFSLSKKDKDTVSVGNPIVQPKQPGSPLINERHESLAEKTTVKENDPVKISQHWSKRDVTTYKDKAKERKVEEPFVGRARAILPSRGLNEEVIAENTVTAKKAQQEDKVISEKIVPSIPQDEIQSKYPNAPKKVDTGAEQTSFEKAKEVFEKKKPKQS